MVRVRFAPSPTGALHIGSTRTALFNYLFARNKGGVFILRIEDSDTTRSTEESVREILEGLKWLALNWDEGPYFQKDRFDRYRELGSLLLETGKAYRCYCSPTQLEKRRQEIRQKKLSILKHDPCRDLVDTYPGQSFVIRLKTPRPGTVSFKDHIHGQLDYKTQELDDPVLLRSDGTPTYNFCVVTDDHDMNITHVIRGDDHLNNTPRQLLIYQALGFNPPEFVHLPMIHGEDNTRLSKRHGARSISEYRMEGYLPHALCNYLARFGWSYGNQELFTMQELVDKFSLGNLGKSAGIFNPQKLRAINAHHLRQTSPEQALDEITRIMERQRLTIPPRETLLTLVKMLIPRSHTFVEIIDGMEFYLAENLEYDSKAVKKHLTPEKKLLLGKLLSHLLSLEDYSVESVENFIKMFLESENLELKSIAQPLRVALTGKTTSPGIFEVISVLGKEKVQKQIQNILDTR